MDYTTLVARLADRGDLLRIALNPQAQFGVRARQYMGPTIMPEVPKLANEYTESFIRYRSPIANHGTRYSAAQYKEGALVGSMRVTLGHSDIASDLTAEKLDALQALLDRNASLDAMLAVTNFIDSAINVPLIERNEADRWAAIINGVVPMRGDNGYTENVLYPNPSGNRAAIAGPWSTNTNDPYSDIMAVKRAAAAKGLTIKRIITTTHDLAILANNLIVQGRTGRTVLAVGGSNITLARGAATLDELNAANRLDGLPPFETYDLQYQTQAGTVPFFPTGNMVFICDTQRDPGLDLGDLGLLPPEILAQLNGFVGYVGVGKPAGQAVPGRKIWSEGYDNKPPRIECEGWQTSLPIITEPDAVFVLNTIT